MANVITQDDLGKDKTNQNNNQQNQVGLFSSAQSPNSPSGKGSGTVTSFNPNTQRGTGYTNIQRVLQANTGNKLGQTVGGGIQQAGQQVQNNLNQSQQNFQQQSQANQFNTDQNNQLAQNALNDPTQVAQGSPEAAQFQRLISGQYAGPTGLQNYEQLQSQAGDVNQLSQSLGTAAGRQGLLQRFVGNPQYFQGQQTLDALLLGQQQKDLSSAKRAALGLQQNIAGTQAGAAAQAQQYGSEANLYGQNLQTQLGKTAQGVDTGLQQQAKEAQLARDTQYQNLLRDVQMGKVTQQEADLLGLKAGDNIYGTNDQISKYVNQNPMQATAQNVASSGDYARLQALQQLAGQYVDPTARNVFGAYEGQSGQAGQFQAGKMAEAQPGFGQLQKEAAKAYEPLPGLQKRASDINSSVSKMYGGNTSDADIKQLMTLDDPYAKQMMNSVISSELAREGHPLQLNTPMGGDTQAALNDAISKLSADQKFELLRKAGSVENNPNHPASAVLGALSVRQQHPELWGQLTNSGAGWSTAGLEMQKQQAASQRDALAKALQDKYGLQRQLQIIPNEELTPQGEIPGNLLKGQIKGGQGIIG